MAATSPEVSASMEPPESVGLVRDPGGYPPEYVCDAAMGKAVVSPFFSLEIEHNGIFCGPSSKLEYVSPTVEILDYCSAANFSYSFIEEHLKWLSYPVEEHNIYWCRPGCVMSDGLVRIKGDDDVQHMIRSSGEHKVLVIIIDHSNFIHVCRNDVIYEIQCSVPMSPLNQQREIGNISENAHQATGEVTDSDFSDSDFSIDEGDDDLFDENIDFDVEEDEPEEVDVEPEYVLEDQDLELSREEEEKLKYKFSAFNAKVDMDSPIFKVGMVFADVKELRKALIAYSIRNRVQVCKVKNETKRLDVVCKPGCPWLLKAGKDNRTGGFVIKSYAGVHKCQKSWKLKALTANFLTSFFIDEFRDDQKMGLGTFSRKATKEFNITPNRWKLARARKQALKIIHGDEDEQFSKLWDYGHELRTCNPGSTFLVSTQVVTDEDYPMGRKCLKSLYWLYDACKRGWLEGCRPIIFVDGCHMKTKYKGVLLTAVGIDPNDCIYPIAMGWVEVECTSSWVWFLTTLRDDLNILNTAPFTIMSDKQKGLINAVMQVWADAEHMFCVRHIYQNFHEKHKGEVLKQDLWAIARSTNTVKWRANCERLDAHSSEAFHWTERLDAKTWVKAFFSEFSKCDILLNNNSEVFNSYILDAREMVVLSMLENIFYKLMHRMQSKQREAVEKWAGSRICPKILKKLDKNTEYAANCHVAGAGQELFKVMFGNNSYNVDLSLHTCDCRRWQLSGIPCGHGIACMREERIDPETMVHECYTVQTYLKAYGYNLMPLRDQEFWVKMDGDKVYPPVFTKQLGRPKKNRKKTPEEKVKGGVRVLNKNGVTMHCSICGKPDHNRKGHYKYQEAQLGARDEREDEDYDDPTFLQNIFPHLENHRMDPSQVAGSMISHMARRERTYKAPPRFHGPLPEQSAFVAAAGAAIPQPFVNTEMNKGRTTRRTKTDAGSQPANRGNKRRIDHTGSSGEGRGRGRSSGEGRGRGRSSGAGRGRARSSRRGRSTGAAAGTSSGGPGHTSSGGAGHTSTGAHYLLFGDDRNREIPDLNAAPDEMHVSQNAPNA